MQVLSIHAPGSHATAAAFRFAGPPHANDDDVHWLLKRNCSVSPRQLLGFYLSLLAVSLLVAGAMWMRGAPLVMPFAGVELIAVGLALLVYARHAADSEEMVLRPGSLTVECRLGESVDRVEFEPARVRVEPKWGDGSLIELSGQGRRIAVGRFVRPELRRALADELRAALARTVAMRPAPGRS
ncbi:MAG: DUF2244 domain-containing protein [Caldimonas sp.]